MVQILDDDHLESLLCTKCRKYLSVFPVKNHPSRDVTCGRCSRDDDGGVPSSRYELIASGYLFRCVNRYEGCRELLRPDETEAHEKTCFTNTFDCPKCRDGSARTVLGLMWHYRLRHPTSYLKKNCFEARPPFVDDAMLYVRDDVVFIVTMRRESNATRLNVATLTDVEAMQTFVVLRSGAVYAKSERRRCARIGVLDDVFVVDAIEPFEVILDLEVSTRRPYGVSVPRTNSSAVLEESQIVPVAEPAVVLRGGPSLPVHLSDGFERKFGYELDESGTALISRYGHRIDLVCSNCGQWIGVPVYRCMIFKHMICRGCRAWCGICECHVVTSYYNDLLVELIGSIRFPCKWKCGGYLGSELHDHESTCDLRIKKCPECPIEIHLKDMKQHLSCDHRKCFLEQYVKHIVNIIDKKNDGELYFLLSDKWCYLKWSHKGHNGGFKCYNFTFHSLEPNTKLGTIYNSKCSYDNNVRTSVPINNVTQVYLKFN